MYKAIYNRISKEFLSEPKSFKLITKSDVPSGSGLGGSSTLVVAIIKAFSEWLELSLDMYQIAKMAFEIERIDMNIHGGAQDQYAATFGGLNKFTFKSPSNISIGPDFPNRFFNSISDLSAMKSNFVFSK